MQSKPADPAAFYKATIEKLRAHPELSKEVAQAIREKPIFVRVQAIDFYRLEKKTAVGWHAMDAEGQAPWVAKAAARAAESEAKMQTWRESFPAASAFLAMTDVEREDFFAGPKVPEVPLEAPPEPEEDLDIVMVRLADVKLV